MKKTKSVTGWNQPENTTVEAKLDNKITITVEWSKYGGSKSRGNKFTSVGFMASTYGAASPCDTNEEVARAIAFQKQWILNEEL